jgi:hypothetical protein
MYSFDSAIAHLKFYPFLSHVQHRQPVPLDGTESARLVNMRLAREKIANATNEDPVKDRWFYRLHSDDYMASQCTIERNLASWFLKGCKYFRPAWSIEDEETDRTDRARRSATIDELPGYRQSAEGVLRFS